MEHSVPPAEFNSFGSRRGNHEVMMRGTFGNIRLRNLMVPGMEGPWTRHVPSGDKMSIYDAAMRYQREATPLIVIAGKEYGSGSSRDWAAKGSALLGIKAVIAQSLRTHSPQQSRLHGRASLAIRGRRIRAIVGSDRLRDLSHFRYRAWHHAAAERASLSDPADELRVEFDTTVRIDAAAEVEYFRNGGILQMVLRQLQAA